MAAPEALGRATSGLFVRDTRLRRDRHPVLRSADLQRHRRRAAPLARPRGLIERSWERTSGLSGPFLPGPADPATSAPTGSLVLNSTRVADGCRMWVSQIRLATGDQDSCAYSSGTPAGDTVDLLAAWVPEPTRPRRTRSGAWGR
jgi:hypothetical protein